MSGGSYNYLFIKEAAEVIGSHMAELEAMTKRLAQLHPGSMAEISTVLLYKSMSAAKKAWQDELDGLANVFQAVEWYDSSDSSKESVEDAVKEYERLNR